MRKEKTGRWQPLLLELIQLARNDLGRLDYDHPRNDRVRGGNGVHDVARDALGREQALHAEVARLSNILRQSTLSYDTNRL